MSLIKVLLQILRSARKFILYIFEYDYSLLEREILGISLIEVCGLLLCFYLAKEVTSFLGSIMSRMFGGIYKQGIGYISFGIHRMISRCYCTMKYIWDLPVVARKRMYVVELLKLSIINVFLKLKNLRS